MSVLQLRVRPIMCVPASPYPQSRPCAFRRTSSSAFGSISGIFAREPPEAYESSRAHRILVGGAFLAAAQTFQACRGVEAAFSCQEEAEAFLEGSSWSTTRASG